MPPDAGRCHFVRIPYVETNGAPGAPFGYVNGAHAALHSILAALRCDDVEDVRHWLDMAGVQLLGAVQDIRRPGARVAPDDHYWNRVEAAQAVAAAAGFESGLQFPPTDDLRRLEAQKRLADMMLPPNGGERAES